MKENVLVTLQVIGRVIKVVCRSTRWTSKHLARWLWRLPRWGKGVLTALTLVLYIMLEPWSGAYWLGEAMYFEARDESFKGRWAVANVIVNRIGNEADPEWHRADSVAAIVDGGRQRGRSCQFSYRCDGRSDNPWRHDSGYWDQWLSIRLEAWLIYGLKQIWLLDITDGALFYKRHDAKSPWFRKMIKSGRMRKVPGDFGAHVFYQLGPEISLKGSPESVRRSYMFAKQADYERAETGDRIKSIAYGFFGLWPTVESIAGVPNLNLSKVSYPYLLPEAKLYITRLSKLYAETCGEPLTLTSAMRPIDEQPSNASKFSVHPTGMAFDLSVASNQCVEWLKRALLSGERSEFLDVTREKRPAHLHVVVYPDRYLEWLKNHK